MKFSDVKKLPPAAKIGIGVVCALVTLTCVLVVTRTQHMAVATPVSRYFSTDDGATYFQADPQEFPPCTIDGKTAVEAMVYKDAAGKPFVAYLQQVVPSFKNRPNPSPTDTPPLQALLVKKPKEGHWVSAGGREGFAVTSVVNAETGRPFERF